MADEIRAFWDYDESRTFWHRDGVYQYCIMRRVQDRASEGYFVQRTFASRTEVVESILHDDGEWYDPIFPPTGATRKFMSLEGAQAVIDQDAKLLGVFDHEVSRTRAI
ncbi:MAG: hypothetical protein LIO94_10105 [Clostridiales bacterium]|nr:hypothetical protein [Clostridiales bacterium]